MTLYPVEMQARRAHVRQPIPIYIEPMPGEALASWLCRLASKIGLPPLAFIRHAFGIDCRSDAQWWRRPSREQLATVAAGTGVTLERLAAMTLADWSWHDWMNTRSGWTRSTPCIHPRSMPPTASLRPACAAWPKMSTHMFGAIG